MNSLAAQYAQKLPKQARTSSSRRHGHLKSVLLTGSTGSIGSFLLDCMMRNDTIARIYCLNRAGKATSVERQRSTMKANGLSTFFPISKVIFLEADLAQPDLGLSHTQYSELLEHVTHIVHQAWEVNFARPLTHFEPSIQGVCHLIDFCAQSIHNSSLFFASTIGAVSRWTDYHPNPVPEVLMTGWQCTDETAYSQAKSISERLLAEASSTCGLDVQICRIGQVAGPTTPMGQWNPKEWFPSFLASSIFLGIIPGHFGAMETVDWIPVDLLAQSIVEVYLCNDATVSTLDAHDTDSGPSVRTSPGECLVSHMVNPQRTTYSALLPSILEYCPSNIQLVTYTDWVVRLEGSQKDPRNPALKLLGLYKAISRRQQAGIDFAQLGTKNTAQQSETLRSMGPVTNQWMSNWMRQWNFSRESTGGSRL